MIATQQSVETLKPSAMALSPRQRLLLIAFNYIPFLNMLIIATLSILAATICPRWTWIFPPLWLLIVPPLVVRCTRWIESTDDVPTESPVFLRWWFTAQWQVIFNRLPWIEEMIRLVPGLYSTWLRLWGARVGKFVYWTPGLRILDRSLIDIGDRVIFGAGVKINPHIIAPNREGKLVLKVARVRIGGDAIVGGYSLLTAGCWIAAGEASPGMRPFPPFSGWENGHRVRGSCEKEMQPRRRG
ncbi:MAG TPA: hypothetical protein VL282_07110 [Tepidisphaeraceae bacterium]|jgi:hypothetical protein|nr:hypothetical protein [Tepidisphaeraceae bacterium]